MSNHNDNSIQDNIAHDKNLDNRIVTHFSDRLKAAVHEAMRQDGVKYRSEYIRRCVIRDVRQRSLYD